MATNDLTAQRLRELFDYDPETGLFTRRIAVGRHGCIKAGSIAGGLNLSGYVTIGVDNRRYYAHRLVWLHVKGEWPTNEIDHVDGDPANNRLANLRDASSLLNKQNRRVVLNGTGLMGVKPHRTSGGFSARIRTGGACIHLGMFATAGAAHDAYIEAKRRLHAGCTI